MAYASLFWGNLLFGLLYPLAALAAILLGLPRRVVLWGGLLGAPVIAIAVIGFRVKAPALLGVSVPAWLEYLLLWLLGLVFLLLFLDERWGMDIRIGVAAMLIVVGILAKRWNVVVPSLIGYSLLPYPPARYIPTGMELLMSAGVYAVGGLFFAFSAWFLLVIESKEPER